MPKASATQDGVASRLRFAAKAPNLRGTGIRKKKGLTRFAVTSHMRFARRQACLAGNLLIAHLVEAAYGNPGIECKLSQLPNEFLIRASNDHGEGFGLRADGRDVRKVAGGNYDRTFVLNNKRVRIADGAADRLDLGIRLSGAENQRDVLLAQPFDRRGSASPGIRVLIEQGTVQVSKDEGARSLRDGERPPLPRPRYVPWVRATGAPCPGRRGRTQVRARRRCPRTQWQMRPAEASFRYEAVRERSRSPGSLREPGRRPQSSGQRAIAH